MKFPNRGHLRGTASVIEIFKGHAQYLSRQGLRQLSAVLGIEREAVLCKLRLGRLPRTAIFAVHRSLHNDAGRSLVRRLRDFKMHIAVGSVYAGLLHERISDVKHLELAAGPRGIRCNEGVLGPAQNRVDPDFLGRDAGNGHVFGRVTKVSDIRFDGETLA